MSTSTSLWKRLRCRSNWSLCLLFALILIRYHRLEIFFKTFQSSTERFSTHFWKHPTRCFIVKLSIFSLQCIPSYIIWGRKHINCSNDDIKLALQKQSFFSLVALRSTYWLSNSHCLPNLQSRLCAEYSLAAINIISLNIHDCRENMKKRRQDKTWKTKV